MNDAIREYLARIGQRGGQKSRRTLDPETARQMVRVREARRAFRRFYTLCFWSYRPDLRIGVNDVDWVTETLLKQGDRDAWLIGRSLCRAGEKALLSDTPPAMERVLIEGYRAMSPSQKLQRVVALNRALERLARARIRAQYGHDLTEREIQLRLGALRLDRDLMLRIFGWDPEVQGY